MPSFYYKAVNLQGETFEGEMVADKQSMVVARLQEKSLMPIQIELLSAKQQKKISQAKTGKVKTKVKFDDVVQFTQQLATLLNAGLPLDRCLQTLVDLADKPEVVILLQQIQEEVRGGASLAVAVESHRAVFGRFYVNMIKAGEAGIAMDQVLSSLAEFLERSKELKETVKSALIYPMVLLTVAGLSVILLLTFVVPQFTQMFEDAGQALPIPTQIVIAMGEGLQQYWWLLLWIIVGIAYYFKQQFANPKSRYFWDKQLLQLPLVGDLMAKIEVARFSRTLGTLLSNGVPLLTGLAIIKEIIGNLVLAESIAQVTRSVKEGKGLTRPLAQVKVFPKFALQMLSVGEETGHLDAMLIKVADVYDQEVKLSVQRLLALLEPALILGLGITIAGIIFSILLAILSVNELAI